VEVIKGAASALYGGGALGRMFTSQMISEINFPSSQLVSIRRTARVWRRDSAAFRVIAVALLAIGCAASLTEGMTNCY
jgi:hypothetical protein